MHEPSEENGFMPDHVSLLLDSYHALTGKHLIAPDHKTEMAKAAYDAPFVLLSHGMEQDPILNYGNRSGQRLFAMTWDRLTSTPSRFTAEAPNQAERESLLKRVTENGYIDDYSGIRIAADGRRFVIRNATVWNVSDAAGRKIGQAAAFSEWEDLPQG
ncbi:MAG: MEKHLA domain-containing protein [Akkermansiaceae bacterium]|jgi:hypothetical protein|nr:MEKHLA domain-containing protein [Akkermansiaceae bacterium]MDP4647578.1 MEKHLA domain-containing protein [Akkermansiaceae bacterium]MDP4720737.1 MEKHLA domain-containing protein [Akkermansiaceae bacterium]MDP4779140.1 MEKHLA domain-containing protein [Akkermansiaceae bacterium]MDP4847235.1 MEKHLA domain-containing protein [Akkermansiaceae bacterium]